MSTQPLHIENDNVSQDSLQSIPDIIGLLATAVQSNFPHKAIYPLIEQLSDAWNKECDDSDQLITTLETTQDELVKANQDRTYLDGRAKMWKEQAATNLRNQERFEALVRNLRTDLDIEKKAHKEAKRLLEVEQQDHKRCKGQVKRLKESSDKFKTRAASLEKATIELRADAKVANDKAKMLSADKMALINELANYKMVTVWAENGEALMLLPNRLTISIEGRKRPTKAFTLLFTDSRGIWRQVAIDEDHRVSFSKFAYCDQVAKSTTDAANRALLKPSKDAVAIAERWLYKVNVVQNGAIGNEDLDIRNTAEYLALMQGTVEAETE